MASNKRKGRFKGAVGRNSEKQSRGSKFSYLLLPKGISEFEEEPGSRVSLDILPYVVASDVHPDRDDEYGTAVPDSLWYKRPFYVHRNFGPDNITVACPSSFKKPCPICEYRAQMLKDGASWDDDAVKGLKASMRNLYYIIPIGSKKYEEKPHIWDISQFLFQNKLNEEIAENEDYETFPSLDEDGYTLKIRFSEETFGSNKFADTSRIDFIERKESYEDSILDKLPDLDEVLEVQSYKSLQSQFFGNMAAEAEEEQDDRKSRRNRDEEDEQDEKPARQSRRQRDEEDDDKDEKPSSRRQKNNDDEKPARSRRGSEDSKKDKDEDPPEKETRSTRRSEEKSRSQKPKEDCPHGHEFGKDNDEFEECDKCDKWDDCFDKKK